MSGRDAVDRNASTRAATRRRARGVLGLGTWAALVAVVGPAPTGARADARGAAQIVVATGDLAGGATGDRARDGEGDRATSLERRLEKRRRELERIEKQIREHRARSRKLDRQEKAVLGRLRRLDREIDLSRAYLRKIREQEALLGEQIDSLRAAVAVEDSVLSRRRRLLARRLRRLYVRDPTFRWDVILGASSLHEAVTRYRFLRLIAEHDAAAITDFRERKVRLQAEQARLTEALAEVAMLRQRSEEEARRLELARRRRERALADIRSKKSRHERAIAELEKSQAQVRDLIGTLEKKRLEARRRGAMTEAEFAALRGRMPWPVEGRVVKRFGRFRHPKYGTVTYNNGIDIAAAAGSPIQAVAAGAVEFVDWIDAYGKCIILNHGGGYYTLYAHVGTTFVRQGQDVAAGEVIAEVGDSGSLEGFRCHFEVRKARKALDPLEWLAPRGSSGASR